MLRLRSTLPAPGRKETKSRNTSLSQIMDYLHRQPERGERGVKGVTSHEKRRRRPLSRAFHFLFLFVLSDRNAAALLVRAFSDMFLQRDANLSLRRKFKKTVEEMNTKRCVWKHYRRGLLVTTRKGCDLYIWTKKQKRNVLLILVLSA